MSAQQLLLPFRPVINIRGGLEAGATLEVYQSGTSVKVPIYRDSGLTKFHTNPVKADGFGVFPPVYFDDNTAIRVVLKAANGTVFADQDPYNVSPVSVAAVEEAASIASDAAGDAQQALSSVESLIANLTVTTATSGSVVASRALLAGIVSPVNGQSVLLSEDGLVGLWKFTTTNQSANVTADPDQGLYIAPASAPTGASGAWVRVVEGTDYMAEWWLDGSRTLVQDRINRALKLMPAGATLRLPPATMTVQRAAAGSVAAGSSTVNSGIIGAIYIEKDGQKLVGAGINNTILDGAGGSLNVIMIRASGCEVRGLRAGNVTGQLITNEAAGVCCQPKLPATVGGTGANVADCVVEDCWFYDAFTGVTATAEAEIGVSPERMWINKRMKVNRCRFTNIKRQGVELAVCDQSTVSNCTFVGGDRATETFSRFVRVIGSRGVFIYGNHAIGFDPTYSGYFGVSVETLGFYGRQAFYEISSDVHITENTFENFGVALEVIDSQGAVNFHGNIVRGPQAGTAANFGVRVSSAGIRNPGYVATTLSGNRSRTDGHGLTTGTPIQTLFNTNGLTFGTTYYAIRVNDNEFRWASSEANALAGTALTLTGTADMFWHTETGLFGIANKNKAENLSVKDNYFVGVAQAVAASGRATLFEATGNTWIANNNTSASGINLTMVGTHPFENIVTGKIEGNTLLGNDVASSAPIIVGGMKSTSFISVNGNKLSASTSGATITHSGPGVLQAKDRFSNTIITRDNWLENFDPPAGNIFTGN